MSAKWIRAKKWDDEHLGGWLWPVKAVLRTFSGIPLAVVLLSLVALFGILASVPIGLIALAPTYAIYALTVMGTVALLGVLPGWMLSRGLRRTGLGLGARFAVMLPATILLTVCALALWRMFAWPLLRYDPLEHTGLRLFAPFVDAYKAVQFRRLPMMEMSELEFYAWWPLRLVLVLFVVNMVTATVRRIEFSLPHVGVLTVHTGIVVIALGSMYYASLKQEGDMILLAGPLDGDGNPTPGPPETGFYDNTDTALWVTQDPSKGWEQRRLDGLPRYHDYNLNALGLKNLPPMARGDTRDLGPLDIRVPGGPGAAAGGVVDSDVRFRVVGYAPYADLISQWMPESEAHTGHPGTPIRVVEAYLDLPRDENDPDSADPSKPRKRWQLLPAVPAERVDLLSVGGSDLLGIEYTRGMSETRWHDLNTPLPKGTRHALVVRCKGAGFEGAYPVQVGQRITVGDTGYTLEVVQLSPTPPFPIITRGYQGATSSIAVVRVRPPKAGERAAPAYERWVYHRFPEISQDLVDGPAQADGKIGSGQRRAADSDLDIDYIDASILQIYLDEREDGSVRALVRLPGGGVSVTPSAKVGDSIEVSPGFTVKLADRMDDAVMVEYPFNTPTARRDPKSIGNHLRAAVAVEVSATLKGEAGGSGGGGAAGKPWKTIVWAPFTQYARAQTSESEREVGLPDGRRVHLMFGRVRHEFWPPMGVRMADFEMIPYEHSQVPRDYRSDLIVMRRWKDREEDVRRETSLNEPLLERTPYQAREDLPWVVNAAARVVSWIAPNQYKFSQAGWDQGGWTKSREETDRGERRRPYARYTILGVGNNPGIYIIAAGAVLMSVGIPMAFYGKPWLLRRRKRRIQAQIARGEIPVRAKKSAPAVGSGENGSVEAVSGVHP